MNNFYLKLLKISKKKETESNFRNDLKIIIGGNYNSNKASFVNEWTKNQFSDTYKPTIYSEFWSRPYEYEGKIYRIHL